MNNRGEIEEREDMTPKEQEAYAILKTKIVELMFNFTTKYSSKGPNCIYPRSGFILADVLKECLEEAKYQIGKKHDTFEIKKINAKKIRRQRYIHKKGGLIVKNKEKIEECVFDINKNLRLVSEKLLNIVFAIKNQTYDSHSIEELGGECRVYMYNAKKLFMRAEIAMEYLESLMDESEKN